MTSDTTPPLLDLRSVDVTYGGAKEFTAVRNASLTIAPGRTVGLVGESGSGKSTLARCVVGLVRASSGSVHLDGEDVTNPRGPALASVRKNVQMVFQDPRSSLNPRLDIGTTLREVIAVTDDVDRGSPQARDTAVDLMARVGLDRALLNRYPHQLSGGQLQRVAIARAVARRPRLMLLDEVTASLDVSAQATVLNLLRSLQEASGFAVLLITHDLAVVRYMCDEMVVMRRGEVVEHGATGDVMSEPRTDYTRSLLDAIPSLGRDRWRSGAR
ncbi:ABC transporter ATP-binding protein [Aeromicrobium choanae]|uniref:Peptide/nickel transport system ATP-binding protein n=1 Tax=Aeromicrobium choanae TaxID=1736691 RepID=A0A1T4Z4F3_9ACTN|nr:ABC transporter ATP-binding protein [Aeromicrobium choanae]SKB08451.1 peptide/nickel transport system ATP-binding protein [Aeromicrobium choanae]